jgi:GDP-D-mannose dehydratase
MAKQRVLITGITGQDGSYLAEYLLDLGYEVWGTSSANEFGPHAANRWTPNRPLKKSADWTALIVRGYR